MHIPDGFVDLKTAVTTGVFSIAGFITAIVKVKQYFKARVVVLMGIFAALIFAAQMVNFTILGGTSGHLLGAALAAIVLGPYGGGIVIAAVLVVQAFLFGDGGITALGANIFNMAIVGILAAYLIFKLITKFSKKKSVFFSAVAISAWFSVVVASIFASLELAISGIYPLAVTLKAMVPIHMMIGLGEAAITTAVVAFVYKLRPELILSINWVIDKSDHSEYFQEGAISE